MSCPFRPTPGGPAEAGFSLVEMTIALGVGMFVVLTAYAAVRSAGATIRAADRMALENRLLRAGFLYALDDIDYWTLYDDPEAPAGSPGQRLRGTVLTALPGGLDGGKGPTHVPRTLGQPFTALKDLPPPNEFADGVPGFIGTAPGGDGDFAATDRGWSLRPGAPLLLPSTDAEDLATGAAFAADLDRGLDPHRPYQANDPAAWYRGSVLEAHLGRRDLGRYGLLSNLRKTPRLGHGEDARDPGWRFEDLATNGNPGYPGYAKYTGPFGQQAPAASRTFTRHENRVLYLFEALGNFAVQDYLPANAIVGVHGAVFRWPTGDFAGRVDAALNAGSVNAWPDPLDAAHTLVAIDEAADLRFTGVTVFDWVWEAYWSRRLGTNRANRGKALASSQAQLSGNTAIGVVPGGPWSGSAATGYGPGDGADNEDGNAPGSSLTAATLAHRQRYSFPGPKTHVYNATATINRLMQVAPVLPLRPADWPDLRVGSARTVVNSRFLNSCFVRWLDQATGQEVELEITATGTTLRGARAQRHRDGGWATFRGVSYDPATGVLWDNPRPGADPGWNAGDNNDPTLDYPPDDPATGQPPVPARRTRP